MAHPIPNKLSAATLTAPDDPRLVFDDALFVSGSIAPGDDVLVALDLRSDVEDPKVFISIGASRCPIVG